MSKTSEKARAERRAADREPERLVGDVLAEAEDAAAVGTASVHAVALVPEEGGFRLVTLALTPSMAEACATSATEPEVLQVQLAKAQAMLEDAARGMAPDGAKRERVCPTCGVQALVRHPSKPLDVCCACDARHEVSA